SRKRDFEGYRVYTSRFDINEQYSLVANWDKEDFTRWAYDSTLNDWKQVSYPLTTPQWQKELSNPAFDPVQCSHPSFETAYRDTFIDTVRDVEGTIIKIVRRERYSYWLAEGPNRGNSYYGTDRQESNPIQRVAVRDTVVEGDSLTYGVYEITIDNLNGGVPLYFAVTAFDFGDYAKNVPSIESSPSNNAQYGFPIYSAEVVTDSNLKVSVYPNPYKSRFRDAFGNWQSYHGQGYEAPGRVMTPFDRRIWFINLPDSATIRIYTLDGDLVREIDHPDRFLTRYSSVVGWDLISRNTQEVESGIYIYRVDSRLGTQIGKIVIIK
ncbi:MAG: hypothetical protein HY304_05445, partial [candidate division Zixibacteria bacterium]|nr:hypothetical protein [candidate division Zixibacteria bacterium]